MKHRSTSARCVAALIVAASLSAGAPARGQSAADVSAARDLFVEGSTLSASGNWAEAQKRFERSLKLKRAAITFYSLAVVETHTGRLVEALEHFRAFLAEPSAPATKGYEAPATAAIAELEHKVAHCTLIVTPKDLPELTVTIDGDPVPPAALGLARLVNPGTHTVAASARGFRKASTPLTVAEGASAKLELTLEPLPQAAASPLAAVGPLASRPAVPAPPAAPPPSRVVPISLLAAGGALLVAGVAVGVSGIAQASGAPTRDGPDAGAARTKGLAGDVVAGVGIAGVGVGAILLIVQATRKREPGRAALVTPSARGLAIAF